MDGRDSFWLDVHLLARAIEQQGAKRAERIQSLVEAYEELAPMARDEVRKDLSYILAELQAVHAKLATLEPRTRRTFLG
jgi:tRNA A-37 threonylcarbamoyl transferase component Bud32